MMQTQKEMKLARGFIFCPTDEEAIQYYLKKKVMGLPLAYNGIVLERNPYDEKQIPNIFAAAEKRDIYFFTKLTRKGRALEGSNFNRSVGESGTWRSDSTDDIKDQHGSLIGIARKLGYVEKVPTKKQKLIMTEYSLPTEDSSLPYDPTKDGVLCRVKMKDRSKDGENSANNEEAPLLSPAVDHDHYLEANAANPSNPSSMVNNNSYVPEVEATPTVYNLPLSMGAPRRMTCVDENSSPEVLNTLAPLDYHTNNAAVYYPCNPSLVANGNYYAPKMGATPTIYNRPLSMGAPESTTYAQNSSPEVLNALVYPTNNAVAYYSSPPCNPSSMVSGNYYAPEVEARPTIYNLQLSMGAPGSTTYVENSSPIVPLDYQYTNNAAAYYSSHPYMVVSGNSYTSEVEATALHTGVENSVQDDGSDQLLNTVLPNNWTYEWRRRISWTDDLQFNPS